MFRLWTKLASHPWLVWGSVALTVAIFAALLFGLPVAVRRLPVDFFTNPKYLEPDRRHRAKSRYAVWITVFWKHVLGVALIILGTVFLQGVLVAIMGVALLDFKGKQKLVRRLATTDFVWRLLERMRAKGGCPPLEK